MNLRAASAKAPWRTMAVLFAEVVQDSSHEVFKRNERPQAVEITSHPLAFRPPAGQPGLLRDRAATMVRLYLPCRGHRQACHSLVSPPSSSMIVLLACDPVRPSPICRRGAHLQLQLFLSDGRRASLSCLLQPPILHGLLHPRFPLATLSQLDLFLRVRIRSSLPARMAL
jgi:hypothetical protein